MNEKKIERLILDNTFVGRVASFTKEHPDGEPAVRGAGEAAHAIAKKLAEGVVCQIEGRWSEEMGYYTLTLEAIQPYRDGKLTFALRSPSAPDETDGQRVTVTVTKEE